MSDTIAAAAAATPSELVVAALLEVLTKAQGTQKHPDSGVNSANDLVRSFLASFSNNMPRACAPVCNKLLPIGMLAGNASFNPYSATATTNTSLQATRVGLVASTNEHTTQRHARTTETITKNVDGSETTSRHTEEMLRENRKHCKVKLSRQEFIIQRVDEYRARLGQRRQLVLESMVEPTHFRRLMQDDIAAAEKRQRGHAQCATWIAQWRLQNRVPTSRDLVNCPLDVLLPLLEKQNKMHWLQDKNILVDKMLLNAEVPDLECIHHSEPPVRMYTCADRYKVKQRWNCTFRVPLKDESSSSDGGKFVRANVPMDRMIITHVYPGASRVFLQLVDEPAQVDVFQKELESQKRLDGDDDDSSGSGDVTIDSDDDEVADIDEAERLLAALPDDHIFTLGGEA